MFGSVRFTEGMGGEPLGTGGTGRCGALAHGEGSLPQEAVPGSHCTLVPMEVCLSVYTQGHRNVLKCDSSSKNPGTSAVESASHAVSKGSLSS